MAITQFTKNGASIYSGCYEYRGEAVFTPSFHHCYFEERTLRKIKGGHPDGNYRGDDDREVYRVMKFEEL